MTSPRRRPDRPIRSLELSITFRADREVARRVKEAFPTAQVTGGVCVVRVVAKDPSDLTEKARKMLEDMKMLEKAS